MAHHVDPAASAVEAEVSRTQTLKPDELRALWRETFKKEVPKALTRDLLVRTLCWHIQKKAFGGHSPVILKLLAGYAKGRPSEADRLRRLKAGTELVREFQGQRHTVVITAEGFRWRGEDYSSLTAIARAITGTNWNGPRFFGLREKTDGGGQAPPTGPTARPDAGQGAKIAREANQ
jgi:Protein of unknown function (DUF2924)